MTARKQVHAQREFAEHAERRYTPHSKVAHLVLAKDLVFPTALSLCGRERWSHEWLGGRHDEIEHAASMKLCMNCLTHVEVT